MKDLAVVIFAYNRPDHLDACLKSVISANINKSYPVYVVLDGCKDPKYFAENKNCKKIIEHCQFGNPTVQFLQREENYGLRENIKLSCDKLFDEHKFLIIVEDDLIVSQSVLEYFEWGQSLFAENNLGQVSAFNYSDFMVEDNMSNSTEYVNNTYYFSRPLSWGWMCSRDVWRGINWAINPSSEDWKVIKDIGGQDLHRMYDYNFKGKISSWYITFCVNLILQGKMTLFPDKSLIYNQGHDGSGVHKSKKKLSSFVGGKAKFDKNMVNGPFINPIADKWMNRKFSFSLFAKYIIPIKDFSYDIFKTVKKINS